MKFRYIGLIAAGLGIALLITLFSPYASSDPDVVDSLYLHAEALADRAEGIMPPGSGCAS